MLTYLNADEALIFRITHIDNVPWILRNGLHCRNSNVLDPEFVQIGQPGLIKGRAARLVPVDPGGTLSDYVPFYFTPFSPMAYKIHTGNGGLRQRANSEIVIMVSSLRDLSSRNVTAVFSDRHAFLSTAQFFTSLGDLDKIDWNRLQRRKFHKDYENPEPFERYQAEALVHRHLPVEHLKGIVCFSENGQRTLTNRAEEEGLDVKILAHPKWYFR